MNSKGKIMDFCEYLVENRTPGVAIPRTRRVQIRRANPKHFDDPYGKHRASFSEKK
jgi:hypothetical protein